MGEAPATADHLVARHISLHRVDTCPKGEGSKLESRAGPVVIPFQYQAERLKYQRNLPPVIRADEN
jgi:hypothetical protein